MAGSSPVKSYLCTRIEAASGQEAAGLRPQYCLEFAKETAALRARGCSLLKANFSMNHSPDPCLDLHAQVACKSNAAFSMHSNQHIEQ